MSLRKYFAIAISNDLSNQPQPEKIEAIKRLKTFFDARPDINTGDEAYYPASYVIDPVIAGTADPHDVFAYKSFCAELTHDECRNVESYGFETQEVGPSAFNLY